MDGDSRSLEHCDHGCGCLNKVMQCRRGNMDFRFSEEQTLLKDSVERLIGDRYGDFERRRPTSRNAAAGARPCGRIIRRWA